MLRLSSTTNLSPAKTDDVSSFIREEIVFQKRMGFDALDFSMGVFNNTAGDLVPYAEQAREDAEAAGIRFEICHLPFTTKIYDDMSQYSGFNSFVFRTIDAAAVLGVDFAVMHPTTTTVPCIDFKRRQKYDFVMKHLSPFAEYAARRGVALAVENMRPVPGKVMVHRYCQDPDELCEIADALGVGVCWDFGHGNIAGHRQSEAVSYIGSRLKVLHVNDNLAEDDIHLPPFCGNVDWRDAMKGLSKIGFTGLFNFEIATGNIPAGMRESFARYLVDSAKEIMSYM